MMNPPRTSAASSLKPILRWRKGELIGVGAFGSVYMGMNLDSGELLAVKQVLISSSSRQKAQAHLRELEEEVKLLKNLSHPNIVRYMGTARDENALNIFLEFVPGGSIASLLNKFGPFPELVIKMYTRQILQGLEYLHKNAIMHRDIKGANILVDNKGRIKLADFGASKQVVELVTTTGSKSIKGTPYWMAPEVIRQTGHTLSADIWSVACTVIEMATGKAPWSDQFQEVSALFHIGTTKSHPPIPEYLSHLAQDFLLKCLKQEPHLRPTASELLEHPFIKLDGNLTTSSLIQVPHGTKASQVVDKCKRRHLTGHKVEDPCVSDTLDISTTGRDSLEFFTPDVNSRRGSVDNDFNCLMRLDYDSIMKSFKSASDELFCTRKQSFDPKMEQSTPKSMENPPDVDDVLCNLASPEIMRNKDDVLCNLASPEIMCNKDDENSTMTMAYSYNNVDPAFYSFKCTFDENDDDNEDVTEAKIKAFLEEKASELKILQSPLYMEFHSSWNFELNQEESTITSCEEQIRDTIIPRSSLSKASSQSRVSTARSTVSEPSSISSGSYGSGIHYVDLSIRSDSTTQLHGLREHFSDTQYPSAYSPSVLSSGDQLKLWKEELQQELQMRREEKKMLSRLATSTSLSQGATPRSLKRKLP